MRRIGFLVLSDFSMVALASAIEVLRLANQAVSRNEYSWSIISPAGRTVFSSDGATQARSVTYPAAGPLDLVLVCGGPNVEKFLTEDVLFLLRKLSREGVALGGLGSGAYALVNAGLMSGYKCAIEWHDTPGLRGAHPDVHFDDSKFAIDRDRFTSHGGTAPIALMLELVRERLGTKFVHSTFNAAAFNADAIPESPQDVLPGSTPGCGPRTLARIIELMESALEDPLPISELADQTGVSVRQIQRLFQLAYGVTPTGYYTGLRLHQAQDLILHSSMSITEISISCGFDSLSHFSKSYRSFHGRTPTSERSAQHARRSQTHHRMTCSSSEK